MAGMPSTGRRMGHLRTGRSAGIAAFAFFLVGGFLEYFAPGVFFWFLSPQNFITGPFLLVGIVLAPAAVGLSVLFAWTKDHDMLLLASVLTVAAAVLAVLFDDWGGFGLGSLLAFLAAWHWWKAA